MLVLWFSRSVVSDSSWPHGRPPGPSIHGILQARILEWVVIPFSRGSSWPRDDQTCISWLEGGFSTIERPGKPSTLFSASHYTLPLYWLILCYSVTPLFPILCNPMDSSMPGFPVLHHLLEFTQTHVHQVSDAIQPSHPLSSPSPPAFNLSQHQGLFQWVGSSHQMTKVLELQLQHQSFQWIFRTDFF